MARTTAERMSAALAYSTKPAALETLTVHNSLRLGFVAGSEWERTTADQDLSTEQGKTQQCNSQLSAKILELASVQATLNLKLLELQRTKSALEYAKTKLNPLLGLTSLLNEITKIETGT